MNKFLFQMLLQASISETFRYTRRRYKYSYFVVNPGTPGAECGVSYCPPNSVEATDTEMKYDTFSAFVDEISLPFLEDAEIDYVTEELGAQLTLKHLTLKCVKWQMMRL